MNAEVVIICDDASHASRPPVAVFNFVDGRPLARLLGCEPRTGWYQQPTERNAARGLQQTVTDADGSTRERYRLECGRCRRNVVARAENLYAALDALAKHGVVEASLRLLAATLQRQPDR